MEKRVVTPPSLQGGLESGLPFKHRLPTLFSPEAVAVICSSRQCRRQPPTREGRAAVAYLQVNVVALNAIDFEGDLAFERLPRCHHQRSLQETPHLGREAQLDARLRPNDLRVEYAPMHAYHVCIQASLTGTNGSWDQRASGER